MGIMHVLIDGTAHTKPNIDLIRNMVAVIPDLIGMTKVGEPIVAKEKDEIIGIQIIAESHVAITAKGNAVWVDIFSCKEFDMSVKAMPYINKVFKFNGAYSIRTLDRGLDALDAENKPAKVKRGAK
jgi:S-adenosylmethionine/arginine decarboxylase-like enzyme